MQHSVKIFDLFEICSNPQQFLKEIVWYTSQLASPVRTKTQCGLVGENAVLQRFRFPFYFEAMYLVALLEVIECG
jgi:hypothetical protein